MQLVRSQSSSASPPSRPAFNIKPFSLSSSRTSSLNAPSAAAAAARSPSLSERALAALSPCGGEDSDSPPPSASKRCQQRRGSVPEGKKAAAAAAHSSASHVRSASVSSATKRRASPAVGGSGGSRRRSSASNLASPPLRSQSAAPALSSRSFSFQPGPPAPPAVFPSFKKFRVLPTLVSSPPSRAASSEAGLRSPPHARKSPTAANAASASAAVAGHTVVLIRPEALAIQSSAVQSEVSRVVGFINAAVSGLSLSPDHLGRSRILAEDELLYALVSSGRTKEVAAAAIVRHVTHAWRIQPNFTIGSPAAAASAALPAHKSQPSSSSQQSDLALTQPLDDEEEQEMKDASTPFLSPRISSSAAAATSAPAAAADPNSARAVLSPLPMSAGSKRRADESKEESSSDRASKRSRVPAVVHAGSASGRSIASLSAPSALNAMPPPLLPIRALTTQASPRPPVDAAATAAASSSFAAAAGSPRSDSDEDDAPTPLHAARIGIDKIVVAAKYRRRGLAVALLDAIRHDSVEWSWPPPSRGDVAFAEPLDAGARLAEKYCGTKAFLTYR